jgi:hypothetical protein
MEPPVASHGSSGVPGPAARTYLRVPPYVPVIAGEVGEATVLVTVGVAGIDGVIFVVTDGWVVVNVGVVTVEVADGVSKGVGVEEVELQPVMIKAKTRRVTTEIVNSFMLTSLPDIRLLSKFSGQSLGASYA